MNGNRILAVGLSLAATASMLAGCGTDIPPPLPAWFRIDEIRYWWEGDYLVVNVTFTNVHENFTPGIGSLDPQIKVLLNQQEVLEQDGPVGQETRPAYGSSGNTGISLDFGTDYGRPWEKRWYHGTTTGPMLIPPGTTLSAEFGLTPDFDYSKADDGYYYIYVDMPTWYPRSFFQSEFQGQEDAIYYTGCFNRVVPEFYGVKDGAPDCVIWDCTGNTTESGHAALRGIKESYKPKCDATDATGPDY